MQRLIGHGRDMYLMAPSWGGQKITVCFDGADQDRGVRFKAGTAPPRPRFAGCAR